MQLKAALRAWLAGLRWPDHLPWVLLGLRNAPNEDSGVLAAKLVYWAALALPAEFLSTAEPLAAEFLQKLQQVEIPATRPLSNTGLPASPRPPLSWWFSRSILQQLRLGGVMSRTIVIFNVRVCGQ